MARPAGARPLPNPPSGGFGIGSNGYGNGNSNSSNDSREAAWYEHEERMRPSYIQQPRQQQQRNFTAPSPSQSPIPNPGNPTSTNLPPLSPSARYQYNQQQQPAYVPFPNSSNNNQNNTYYNNNNQQQQQYSQPQPQPQQQPYRTFSNPQPPRSYQDPNRPPLSRSSQSRLASNDLPSEYSNQNLNNRGKGSAFMHKGFFDILSLVAQRDSPSSSSRLLPSNSDRHLQINSSPSRIRTTLSKATGGLRKMSTGGGAAAQENFFQAGPVYDNPSQQQQQQQFRDAPSSFERPSHPSPQSFSNASQAPSFAPSGALNGVRAAKKRISVDMVSAPRPESFVHAAHASDADQAEEILRRWGRDGVGKIADPLWVEPIKEALRQQALRNQAESIAQIQANLHQESVIREGGRELHVMNGAPSVTTTNSQMTMTTAKGTLGHSELSTIGANSSPSPNNGNQPAGYFEGIREEMRGSDGEPRDSPLSNNNARLSTSSPRKIPNTMKPPAPAFARSNTAGTMVINPTPDGDIQALDYMAYKPLDNPHDKPSKQQNNRDSKAIDGLPGGGAGIAAMFNPPTIQNNVRPESMVIRESQANQQLPSSIPNTPPSDPIGEGLVSETSNPMDINVTPSLQTVEKSVAAKIFFENLYYGILKKPRARDTRRQGLETELAQLRIPESSKNEIRTAWIANETEYLRDLRARVNVNSFAKLKTIGHGAFGVVALCRERGTGGLFAMKQLRKADMLRKGQEGHVRAERDLMTSASSASNARWIVKLVYSFQDVDHLYLIMEFMGGGDLLNLLIEKDIFAEDFAKFYVAEMILSIHEAHRLGYIHRDIKPDNFLFTSEGHVKLADFGLCQSFHWAHDGAYYDQQRKNLLKKHGIDLDDAGGRRSRVPPKNTSGANNNKRLTNGGGGNGLNERELNDVMSDRNEDGTPMTHVLTWRDKNKKKIAYSVVGTNNYMAPEVLRGLGYDQSCDWWSLGVIVFEMLYGYPPFVSKSRHLTRQKILNHKQTLKFPPKPKVSRDAQDFILSMICEKDDRLGSQSNASVSRPNSLLQGARRSGFVPGNNNNNNNNTVGGGVGGLSDGVDEIMNHPWLRGIDWNNIHRTKAPFKPALSHPADTKHFEDDIEDEPLPAPGAAEAGPNAPVEQPRDPMLRDKNHGQHLLEMRKQLAFVGYTFKSPKHFDPRTQLDEEKIAAAELAMYQAQQSGQDRGRNSEPTEGGSRVRSMSM